MKRSEANEILKKRIDFSFEYECFSVKNAEIDKECSVYFSRNGCECCDSLPCDVLDTKYLAKSDTEKGFFDNVYESGLCGGCLCSLVNGDDTDLDYHVDDEDTETLDAKEYSDNIGFLFDGLKQLFTGLSVYQSYNIGYNGDPSDRDLDSLLDRVFSYKDDEDTETLLKLLKANETAKIVEFLSYSHFDFCFTLNND